VPEKNSWLMKLLIGGGLLFIVSVAFAAGGAYVTVSQHVTDASIHPSVISVRTLAESQQAVLTAQEAARTQRDSLFDLTEEVLRETLINRRLICTHIEQIGSRDSACDQFRRVR